MHLDLYRISVPHFEALFKARASDFAVDAVPHPGKRIEVEKAARAALELDYMFSVLGARLSHRAPLVEPGQVFMVREGMEAKELSGWGQVLRPGKVLTLHRVWYREGHDWLYEFESITGRATPPLYERKYFITPDEINELELYRTPLEQGLRLVG